MNVTKNLDKSNLISYSTRSPLRQVGRPVLLLVSEDDGSTVNPLPLTIRHVPYELLISNLIPMPESSLIS
ncbi:hypothetical protein HZ326_18262 [Fusarium oxysporum f. sp. albedinis]|nr:hypothetical protein HZ326_18262 [Fusarium oxysporum f. sp. albedinis]